MRVELFPDGEILRKRFSEMERSRRNYSKGKGDRVELSAFSENSRGKLASVRRMIEEGVYTRPSFTEAIAEKIMDSDALNRSDDSVDKSPPQGPRNSDIPDERRKKIENARKKIRSGDYLTSRVLDKIASRLINQIDNEDDSE